MGGCLGRNRGGGRSSNSAVSEGATRANAGTNKRTVVFVFAQDAYSKFYFQTEV
jgi:hypothetical protein